MKSGASIDVPQARLTLSKREAEIVELAMRGLTDKAIAAQLGISEGTVKTYWGRVRAKLGPHSRPELVSIVIRERCQAVVSVAVQEAAHARAELEENVQWRAVVQALPEPLLIVNGSGSIEFANDEAAALLGYTVRELAGAAVSDLVPEEKKQAHQQGMANYLIEPHQHEIANGRDVVALRKDGQIIPIRAVVAPVPGDRHRYFCTFHQCTSGLR